jgi:hypothetical protein
MGAQRATATAPRRLLRTAAPGLFLGLNSWQARGKREKCDGHHSLLARVALLSGAWEPRWETEMSRISFVVVAAGLAIACLGGWIAASSSHAHDVKAEDHLRGSVPLGGGLSTLPLAF